MGCTDRQTGILCLGTLGFCTASAALRYQEQLCSALSQQLPELTHTRSTQQQPSWHRAPSCHPQAHESGARARKAEVSLNFSILLLEGELLSAMFPISQTDLFILAIYREETARCCAAAFHTKLCLRAKLVGTCEQHTTSKPWRPPDDLGAELLVSETLQAKHPRETHDLPNAAEGPANPS